MGLIQDCTNNTVETMSRKGEFAALLFHYFSQFEMDFGPHASREQEKVHFKAIPARNMAGNWLEADFFDLSEQTPTAGLDPIQDLQVE